MGYTHYWYRGSLSPTSEATRQWREAMVEVLRIIIKTDVPLAGPNGTGKIDVSDANLMLNGVGEDAHETFRLPMEYNYLKDFDFCKTAQKPYDVVVTACLALLETLVPGCIEVHSDGTREDWKAGVEMAERLTGIAHVAIPRVVLNPELGEPKE